MRRLLAGRRGCEGQLQRHAHRLALGPRCHRLVRVARVRVRVRVRAGMRAGVRAGVRVGVRASPRLCSLLPATGAVEGRTW